MIKSYRGSGGTNESNELDGSNELQTGGFVFLRLNDSVEIEMQQMLESIGKPHYDEDPFTDSAYPDLLRSKFEEIVEGCSRAVADTSCDWVDLPSPQEEFLIEYQPISPVASIEDPNRAVGGNRRVKFSEVKEVFKYNPEKSICEDTGWSETAE